MPTTYRLVHLETHKIVRDVVKALLADNAQIEYTGLDPRELGFVERAVPNYYDISIVGINAQESGIDSTSGIQLCQQMRCQFPNMKLLAHSAFHDCGHILRLIHIGVRGFVQKSMGFSHLSRAIMEILKGGRYIGEASASSFTNSRLFQSGRESRLRPAKRTFTQREVEILSELANGQSTGEIARQYHLSQRTVETHRSNLLSKSNTKNTAELMYFSQQRGLV